MEQTKHRTFRRRDGVLGVGFVMMFAGVEQASIAWPDRQAERHIVDDLGRHGIEELPAFNPLLGQPVRNGEPDPSAIPMEADWYESVWTEADKAANPASRIPVGIRCYKNAVFHPRPAPEEQAATEQESEASENQETAEQTAEEQPISEAQAVRNYLAEHGTGVTNKAVIAALKEQGITVSSSQVSRVKASFGTSEEAAD